MKISKSVLDSGGVTKDYFNTGIILMIGLFNLINQVLEHKNILQRSYLTIPFIILSILIYHNKTSKLTKSIIFLLIGIGYQVAIPDQAYLGSSIFFTLSFMQHFNNKHGMFILLSSLILVVIKSTYAKATPSQTIITIIGFIFIYGNFYSIVNEYKSKIATLQKQLKEKHKSKPVIRNIDIIKVSEEDKAVLKMYLNGYDYAKISKFLGIDIKKESIRQKITRIRRTTKCENDMQFAIWLTDIV